MMHTVITNHILKSRCLILADLFKQSNLKHQKYELDVNWKESKFVIGIFIITKNVAAMMGIWYQNMLYVNKKHKKK